MSKKRKDWRLYLLDMLECIKRIENYVERVKLRAISDG
jgi:hypothetical protein